MPALLLALALAGAARGPCGREPPLPLAGAPGPGVYRVGRISFTGNTRTCDRLLRTALALDEGDLLDTRRLEASLGAIARLGFVRLAGPPRFDPSPGDPHRLDLTIPVEERPRPQAVLGGTLGDLEGGSLAGQFVAPSLFGCGERLELALQGGDRVLRGGGAFEKPFGAAGTGGLGFERRRLDVEDEEVDGPPAYRDDRTAARLHWTWGIGRDARVSARYERAWIETEPTAPTSVPAELFGEREDSELRLALSRDTVGYCWAPRRGTRVSAVGTLVGGPLGGGTDLLAGEVEALAFLPHTRVTTLALRLSVGAFGAFGDDPVPYDRRYALGGPAEMRGYRPRSVGPRTAAGEVVGGDKKLLLNVEYALDAGDRVQAAVFFDAGNAFAEEEALDPLRLRTSVGTELRVRVPVLEIPLRLILALRLPVDTLEQSGTFTVALGTSLGR